MSKPFVLAVIFLLPPLAFYIHHRNLKRSGDFAAFGGKIGAFIQKKTAFGYRQGYVLTLVSLLILISVLPMLAFFKFAYDREMKLFVRLGQINLARGLEERFDRIHTQNVLAVGKDAKEAHRGDLIEQLLTLDHCDVGNDRESTFCDVYAEFFFNTTFKTDVNDESSSKPDAGTPHMADGRSFDDFLEGFVPFKNSVSLPVRGLNRSMSINNGTSPFTKESQSDRLILHAEEQVDGNPDHKILHVTSDVHTLGHGSGVLWWLGLFLILLLIPSVLFVIITFVGRKIFLLNTDEPLWDYGETLSDSARTQNLLLVGSRFTSKNQVLTTSGYEILDLRALKINEKWIHLYDQKLAEAGQNKKIAINNFEYKLDDSRLNLLKVRLIELLLAHNRTLIVATAVDLAAYDFAVKSLATNGDQQGPNDYRATAIFNSLRRFYLEDKGNCGELNQGLKEYWQGLDAKKLTKAEIKRIRRLLKAVKRECQPRAFLQETGLRLLRRKDFGEMSPERVGWRVLESCDAYYNALWDTCSNEEKLTLVSLATNQLVSSANPTLPRLLRSGLVSRYPFLRPMNESFARFVAAQATPDKLQDWKSGDERSSWDLMKVPLMIIVIGAAAFLFVSQRDLYNSTLAFVSAFAAIMPTLFKFLGLFPTGKT
jgi:hypothetical protein